jgi:meiotically up-regulated gene 157 (Mug157) protein
VQVPEDVSALLRHLASKVDQARFARVESSFRTLFEQALTRLDDGTIFVSTGDIPAMWLRDSTWQLRPLLAATAAAFKPKDAPHGPVCEIIGAVSQRQAEYVLIDAYANAFNAEPNGNCWHKDFAEQSPWVFERKYELDSLAAFLDLALRLYRVTGYRNHLNDKFWAAALAPLR